MSIGSGTPSWRSAFSHRTIGFASMYAWVFTVYLCCSPQAINDSYVALFPLFYLCSFAVAAVALLAFAAFANRAPVSTMLEKASSWKAFCIGGAVCATIGTIWLAVAWTQGSLSLVEIVLIGCTTGFGQASLFLQWGSVLSSRAAVASIEDVCKAFLIASLIVCLQAMFPSILSMLLVALLPLVSAYILVTKLAPFTDCNGGQGERDEGGAYGEGLSNARETNELLLRTCMGALAIGLIMGALRYLAGDDIGFSGMYAVSKITASVICCLVVYFQSRRTRFEFSRIYRYIMLLMGLGIVMNPFFDSNLLPVVVSRIGVSCFETFMWIVVIGFVKCFHVKPFCAVGLCWASLTGGLCGGAAIGRFAIGSNLLDHLDPACLALVFLFALLLVLTFVLTERDLISLEGWGGLLLNAIWCRPESRRAPDFEYGPRAECGRDQVARDSEPLPAVGTRRGSAHLARVRTVAFAHQVRALLITRHGEHPCHAHLREARRPRQRRAARVFRGADSLTEADGVADSD